MDSLHPLKLKKALHYLDKWLSVNFRQSGMPGLQVAIFHKDAIIYSAAFGHADVQMKQKLTSNHLFRVASQSKSFTATAILQLVDQKKLSLDECVSHYLPWFTSSIDPNIATITIRQLLNHTAGLIRDGEESDYWQEMHDFPHLADLKKYINHARLVIIADEQFKYSNFGYGYLGCVIEAVTGDTFQHNIQEKIIEPIGLQSTGVDYDANFEHNGAKGYTIELFDNKRKKVKNVLSRALAPATGLYSNAEDMCRYYSHHFFGCTSMLPDRLKRVMQHDAWQVKGWNERYGLGFIRYEKENWTLVGHSGGFPGFITNSQFDPHLQLSMSVMTNCTDGRAQIICSKIINIIDAFQQNTDYIQLPVKNISKFTGEFYSMWGCIHIVAIGKKLFSLYPLGWNDFNDAEELEVTDSSTLKVISASGYDAQGELIHYKWKANGRIEHVRMCGTTVFPYTIAVKQGLF